MALIKCPECQYDVSDKAAFCLKCGYPFQTKKTSKTPENPVPYSRFKEVNDKNKVLMEENSKLKEKIKESIKKGE
ncbi:MAG: zinc ribbon domain-containing protein [Planctomycetes bacterium]|nr:zinc ribbon domain-containing protein [Planctomycetota bacterium]